MPKVVMRVGRVCPECGRDGTDGQSVVQVMQTVAGEVGCPNCGTRWKDGEVHGAKPEPAKTGKGKAGTKEDS